MSNNFSRTLRALRADGLGGWAVRASVAALLLTVWGLWFFWGRITVWAVSESARAEVSDEIPPLKSPVDGQVVRVHYQRGQRVSQGEVLIELEAFQQEGERDSLLAELAGRRTAREELVARIDQENDALGIWLEASRAAVEEARVRVEQAEVAAKLARNREARVRQLHRENLVPDEELDRVVAELEQAEAEVQSLEVAAERASRELASTRADRQARIDALRSNLSVIEAEVGSLQARIDSLEQQVGLRSIRAPASGSLARVATLGPGAVVQAGDELVQIVSDGTVGAVAFYRPAEAVGRIRQGQSARMRLDGFPSTQFGTLPVTVHLVDREPNEEDLIRVDLLVDGSRPTAIAVQHGMVGTVEVEVDRLSPAALLMRAVGKLLDQPQTRNDSLAATD